MAVRKTIEEVVVVDGDRATWLARSESALHRQGFTRVSANGALYQVEANYKKEKVWGTLQVTLLPSGDSSTAITMQATANVDNIYALFASPGRKIITRFKEGLHADMT
jgi:hypothetical protein